MSLPVFFDTALNVNTAEIGAKLCLRGAEAHHAGAAQRIKPQEVIEIVNGQGLRATITVTAVAKNELCGKITKIMAETADPVPITLVQALIKGGRAEQAIEMCSEYGVNQIVPWEADRCIAAWSDHSKTAKGIAKWQATALAAMKQSRRAYLPHVTEKLNSNHLATWIARQVAAGGKVYLCHEAASTFFSEILRTDFSQTPRSTQLAASVENSLTPNSITLIVGPEGGITDRELALFQEAGAQIVLLSENILRAATAGAWAIAVTRAFFQEKRGEAEIQYANN